MENLTGFYGNMNFWDTGVWSLIITFALLMMSMLVANILRTKIPFLRRLMIPSAVLGGFIALIVGFVYRLITGEHMMSTVTLEELTYHGLGLGFVALTLTSTDKPKSKNAVAAAFHAGLGVVGTYLIQAIAGLAITLGLSYLFTSSDVKTYALGVITALGFGQGPGQAYNWGHTYEATYGFTFGSSFGLTVAAMGFICASLGGIIYLNRMRRKGRLKGKLGDDVKESYKISDFTGANEVPLNESMDKLTIQVALVFMAYLASYLFMWGVNCIIETGAMGNFGYNTIQPLLWGFNFIFGMLFAMLLKAIIMKLKKTGIMKRDYTSSFLQSRLSGFLFDVMVVASIAAIDLDAFKHTEFVVPIITVSIAAMVLTYWYCYMLSRRFFADYADQAFLSMYGMLTGTASTGVILLREVDPKFDIPAADNLVSLQPFAIAFGFPMLLLLSVAPKSKTHAWITIAALAGLFIFINILQFAKYIFKKKKK